MFNVRPMLNMLMIKYIYSFYLWLQLMFSNCNISHNSTVINTESCSNNWKCCLWWTGWCVQCSVPGAEHRHTCDAQQQFGTFCVENFWITRTIAHQLQQSMSGSILALFDMLHGKITLIQHQISRCSYNEREPPLTHTHIHTYLLGYSDTSCSLCFWYEKN